MTRPDGEARRDMGEVRLERADAVAVVVLSRPSALNAMTWAMYEQLEAHMDALAQDTTVRAIVLRGDGPRAFAAGTDIRQFAAFSGQDGVAYERRVEQVMDRLTTMPQVMIAAVHGYAVGGGLALATACDLRYATPAARFGIPVARTLGNCLSLGNYQRLAQAFGEMRTKEMLFTGRLLSAEEARQAEYLTAILEDVDFFDRVLDIARQISANAPLTLWATKEAFRRLHGSDADRHGDVQFDDVIERVYGSADFREGVRAHTEKRQPVWRGE